MIFAPHLLILAAYVLLHVVIATPAGHPAQIFVTTHDMAACKELGAEMVDATPSQDAVSYTCSKRWSA